jgi:predicted PurR-regulated permease PerM
MEAQQTGTPPNTRRSGIFPHPIRKLVIIISIILFLVPQAAHVRKNIREGFRTILKYIPDIPRQALYLEEESKSLEQELTNALREKYA